MKLEKHFAILKEGQETMAEILTTFVYKGDIYMALHISLTDEVELYQIMPRGIKIAPVPVFNDFVTYTASQRMCEEPKEEFIAT